MGKKLKVASAIPVEYLSSSTTEIVLEGIFRIVLQDIEFDSILYLRVYVDQSDEDRLWSIRHFHC